MDQKKLSELLISGLIQLEIQEFSRKFLLPEVISTALLIKSELKFR